MSVCYCESCPEAVPTINITQNTIEVDGALSGFADEYFRSTDLVANVATLAHTPLDAASVMCFRNGIAQGQDTVAPVDDFVVSGADVTLGFTLDVGEVLQVHYFWVA